MGDRLIQVRITDEEYEVLRRTMERERRTMQAVVALAIVAYSRASEEKGAAA